METHTINRQPLTLQSLPRELRDIIYEYVLVAHHPLVVWAGKLDIVHPIERIAFGQFWLARKVDHDATRTSVRGLAIPILYSNKMISKEATSIFYSSNTFAFYGEHNWDPIVIWLQKIGACKRRHICKLLIHARRPTSSHQAPDGTRTRIPMTVMDVYQRSSLLDRPRDGQDTGCVDNINHEAITSIFSLLSNPQNSSGELITNPRTLVFTLQLDVNHLPGIWRIVDEVGAQAEWLGMDLPNIIEMARRAWSHLPDRKCDINLIWRGESRSAYFHEHQATLLEKGWKIITAREVRRPVEHSGWGWFNNYVTPSDVIEYALHREDIRSITQAEEVYALPFFGYY